MKNHKKPYTANRSSARHTGGNYVSAYNFVKRDPQKDIAKAFHDRLLENHYDIAFSVRWETRAATALNPCEATSDPKTNKPVPASCPATKKSSEYAGYNKRWLMIDGRLVISPFTVKSAVANGFANLLGGCYRVAPYALKPKTDRFQNHEDTVPAGNKLCLTTTQKICPRCRMFGMTEESGKQETDHIGLKGRFKSSALISCSRFKEDQDILTSVPYFRENAGAPVRLKIWKSDDGSVCRQLFLPLQGEPKANRTDKDGYFNADTLMKGAKYYHHGNMTLDRLIKKIDERNKDHAYSHRLRNYAQVCQEGVVFKGTLGAENCSADEIAALTMLLDSRIDSHGFKIGLGKALGMGSVISTIESVWVRTTDHQWTRFKADAGDTMIRDIQSRIPGFRERIDLLKRVNGLNRVLGMQERTLGYPNVGNYYWKDFNAHIHPRR